MVRNMVLQFWKSLSLPMKAIFAVCGALIVFMSVHGTLTFRANHQTAFAQAVGKKIGIASIRVSAKNDVLSLEGTATREQSEYAEKMAVYVIERFGPEAINPPTEIRNSLEIKPSETPRVRKQAAR